MSADIRVSTTLPAAHDTGRRLNSHALKVMRDHAKVYVKDWRDKWRGWVYADRPKKAPRLVSQRAWRAKATPTTTGAVLIITNQARDWRDKKRSYVAFVHRAGRPKGDVEWLRVRDQQEKTLDPAFFKALAAAQALGTGPKSRRHVGPSSGGIVVNAGGTVL